MNFGIVFITLGLQIVIALVVVVVLKGFLDRELVEAALERLEGLNNPGDLTPLKTIAVVSDKNLNDELQARINAIAIKRFKGVPLNFSTDPALQGGIMIVVGTTVIDNSVRHRLNALWGRN